MRLELHAFLSYQRAMGFRYGRQEGTLRHFDRHVHKIHGVPNRRLDLHSLIQGWLAEGQGRKPITAATDLGVIRQFCLYRRRHDPDGFVPGREYFPPCLALKQASREPDRPRNCFSIFFDLIRI